MDFWKSEAENGQTNSVLSGMQEFVESPSLSNNSVGYSSDGIESPVETSTVKSPSKSILLAKKRLQAYGIPSSQAKDTKARKPESTANETTLKLSNTKAEKTVYPDEVAKAVIRDIELSKKSGFGCGSRTALSDVHIPEDLVLSLEQVHSDSPSVSVKSDQDGAFIKRQIKCRNIRKSLPYRPKSTSPIIPHETVSNKYPKNWAEYNELNLDVDKDASLKSKLFKKSKDRKFTFKSYFNFETPSLPIENFKVQSKSGITTSVPFSYLRCTASKPQVLYSTSHHKPQTGHLTRDQLFTQIPKERLLIIEKLGKPSRLPPVDYTLTSRKWYPKTWNKIDSSEVKLLEKSVGLSFLQDYSDEEDVLEGHKPDGVEEHNEKIVNLESTPSSPESLEINQENSRKMIITKKSRWDNINETIDRNVSSFERTPPIEDKEEGEVLSEEDEKCDIADEYEKTKEELEKLEATLKASPGIRENINDKNTSELSSEKRNSKKKRRKKHRSSTVKNKLHKKKGSKKYESEFCVNKSSDSLESEYETSKRRGKKKKKKYSKHKHEKGKSRRTKSKKLMKKSGHRSQGEDFDVESELETSRSNKNKSKKKSKRQLDSNFEASCKSSHTKDSDASDQENYEDDIQFFAERFDAETKLKGKSKKKTAPIIALEDLSMPHSKLDDRLSKRKSIDGDALNLPDVSAKKNEEKDREDAGQIKVDLLKMNEDYLREQKKKEEEKMGTPPMQSGIDSEKKMTSIAESSLSKVEQIDKEETAKESVQPGYNLHSLGGEEVSELVAIANTPKEPENTTKLKIVEPDWDILKNKRKLLKADGGDKLKEQISSDSLETSIELPPLPMTTSLLGMVKKEKEDIELNVPTGNSWQKIIDFQSTKSKSLNLEMPLNIKPFLRRDVKIEKDFWDIEEAPTRRSHESNKKVDKNLDADQLGKDDESTCPRKQRSDVTSPSLSEVKLEKLDHVIDVDMNNCVTLENEYEEFLKAVTSTKKPSACQANTIGCSGAKPEKLIDGDCFSIDESPAQHVAPNLGEFSVPVPDVAAIQVPLPPIQPVPAPSPNIEAVIDINKSLINLSVSANVTQNITLSLATSVPSISAPITSSIDIAKPSFLISTPLSMHNGPLPLSTIASVSSLNTDSQPESLTCENNESPCTGVEGNGEKLIFTSLTLPSKKLLMGKSRLNLDDSDDEDLSMVETMKRKKLQSLIEDSKKEIFSHSVEKLPPVETEGASKASSALKDDGPRKIDREKLSPKRYKRDSSPISRRSKNSPVRKRESISRKRTSSPRRKSPKRRSPEAKRKPLGRRSMSPKRRRRSPSPPRRRRSPLLKGRLSPRRNRSITPKSKRVSISKENRSTKRLKSPLRYRELSPLKRSVADSTISDEQLQQVNDQYHSGKDGKSGSYSPRRRSLDDRINEALGFQPSEASQGPCDPPFYDKNVDQYQFEGQNEQFEPQYFIQSQVSAVTRRTPNPAPRMPQSTYKQVGNMLQIVPTENLTDIPMPYNADPHPCSSMADYTTRSKQSHVQLPSSLMKSQYLQVGNMLQIVPTEMLPNHSIGGSAAENDIKAEIAEDTLRLEKAETEKSSAESSMLQKAAERQAEKENRRQEREKRRKEKERRKKAKEKVRQARLKVKTENMIRRALELEGQDEENMEFELASKLVQWPPVPNVTAYSLSKEAGKSILMNSKTRHLKERKVKLVQFADGIRPGEGTSPSGGEELSSPPPPEKRLPKEKCFRKLKFGKTKKKVKVKIIKKLPSPMNESDSDDNLPPPSPPPGSPPPHIFPPRIKINAVNNVTPPFLASMIHSAQQHQQQQPQQQPQYQSNMYRPPLNMLLAHPPSLQGHHPSHGSVVPAGLSPQGLFHPGLGGPPPPPSHSAGHTRHY